MMIVKMQGGLGNQMLIYSFMLDLMERYPDIDIKADTTVYDYTPFKVHNGYEIERIFGYPNNVPIVYASRSEIIRCGGIYERSNKSILDIAKKRAWNKIRKFASGGVTIKDKDWDEWHQNANYIEKNTNYFVNGVWIDAGCNFGNKYNFVSELDEKNANIMSKIARSQSVSIHIRRGDYVGTEFDILDRGYYQNSISRISDLVKDAVFYVFSDDITYCRRLLGNLKNNIVYIDWNTGDKSYIDMLLMSKCRYNILANSTFSLCAALLNKNAREIIYPSKGEIWIPRKYRKVWTAI